jgi:hypothetical protein
MFGFFKKKNIFFKSRIPSYMSTYFFRKIFQYKYKIFIFFKNKLRNKYKIFLKYIKSFYFPFISNLKISLLLNNTFFPFSFFKIPSIFFFFPL